MVGTRKIALIRRRSMVASTCPASKEGRATMVPSRSSAGNAKAPPACDSGVQSSSIGRCGQSHSASWIWASAAPVRQVPITPFGVPVVPPV